MGFEIDSSLSISFQYYYTFADNFVLKIGRSIVENPNIKIDPGFHTMFEIPCDPLRKLEPLIRGLHFAQMNGHIDVTKVISLQKRSKDISQIDLGECVKDEANAL
jgi:hypothetical protein